MSVDEVVERHAQALREVARDPLGGAKGPYASTSNPDYFVTVRGQPVPTAMRRELHRRLLDEVRGRFPDAVEGRRAVVMAGPPGAGKGYIQKNKLDGLKDFVVVDPDQFKELLVKHEVSVEGLAAMTPPSMEALAAMGERFAPMEYSTLVHEESSYLAAQLRRELLEAGTNLVIDTVLKDQAAAESIKETLERAEFTFEVVSVQTTRELSQAGIRGRWETEYRAFLEGTSALGGRPVPSEFARDVFGLAGGKSGPEISADWLRANADTCVGYRVFRRLGDQHELEVHLEKTVKGAWITAEQAAIQARTAKSFPPARPAKASGVSRGPEQGLER